MVFPRGRTSKPKSRPDASLSPRKFSQKPKTEDHDSEEDSQQEDAEKDQHLNSNDAMNTRIQLNRQSILEFCAEYRDEAERPVQRRKQQAKKLPLLLDLFDDPQLGVLRVLFPGVECPPEWTAFQREERERMRREAAEASQEHAPVQIVREVSAFTCDYVIKFTRELLNKSSCPFFRVLSCVPYLQLSTSIVLQ